MFEKLKFWKRNDSFVDMPLHTGLEPYQNNPYVENAQQDHLGFPPTQNTPINPFEQHAFGQEQQFQGIPPINAPDNRQTQFQEHQEALARKDIELILAKLETIKVSIDNLSHRVEKLEHTQPPQQNRW